MELNWHKLKEELQKVDSNRLMDFFYNLHPLIIITLVLINIGIPIITLFYYFWQFEFYHPILWIFIPDSYTYSILFGIFLIVTLVLKKNIQILNIITFIGLIKVLFGYLTLLVFLPSFFSIVSLVAHLIEFSEGLIILLFIRTGNRDFSIATFMVVLDWFFDFFNPFGLPTIFLYPYHPDYNPNPTAPFIFPIFLVFSVLIFFLLALIRLKKWNEIKSED